MKIETDAISCAFSSSFDGIRSPSGSLRSLIDALMTSRCTQELFIRLVNQITLVQDPNDFGDFALIEDGIIRTNASKDAKGAGMLISVKFHSFIHVPQLHFQDS